MYVYIFVCSTLTLFFPDTPVAHADNMDCRRVWEKMHLWLMLKAGAVGVSWEEGS